MGPPVGVAAILPAAGKGVRLGAAKQYLELDGAPLLVHAARAAVACPLVTSLVVAVPPGDEERARELLALHRVPKVHRVVAGGAERAHSVRLALEAIPQDASLVAIHDAARPFASPDLFRRVIEAARERGAAVAALPATDTVKESADGSDVSATLDRGRIWLAQTPQAFRVDWLLEAHRSLGEGAGGATDEAALVEAMGRPVALIPGEKDNFKVTDAADWERARRMMGGNGSVLTAVGFGYDVHAFEEGRPCRLGGLDFPGETGLAGHSDADVVLHAVMDAMLGAAGLGDIGQHFPDTDDRFRGADSGALLREVVARVAGAGFVPLNVDLTIAAARPKVGPRREEMRERIASLIGLAPGRVNVKATTTEGLGFVGRKEGIACQAVVLLSCRPTP